jgi:competence protein ComFC
MGEIFIKIVNLIFPTKCIVCKNSNISLCESCFLEIPKHFKKQKKLEIEVFSFYDYRENRIKEILKQIKYHNKIEIAKYFQNLISNFLSLNFSEYENIFLIPIPLSENDKRLYNHTELFVKNINIENVNTKIISNLFIKNTTIKQAHTKSRNERLENVKNKIIINKKIFSKNFQNINLENSVLILIDDVATTGATLNECREVLLEELVGNLASPNFPHDKIKIIAITIAS